MRVLHNRRCASAENTEIGENMDSVTASIAHEVNQPLTSIVTRGEAAMLWLEREPPKLDDARKSIAVVISEANRAAKVIQSIRGMFKEGDKEKSSFNLNHIIKLALRI